MKQALLYIKHKITWHHYRETHGERSRYAKLGMCTCGWKAPIFRFRRRKIKRPICWVRKHQWGEWYGAETGPAGAPDDQFVSLGLYRHCSRCSKGHHNSD